MTCGPSRGGGGVCGPAFSSRYGLTPGPRGLSRGFFVRRGITLFEVIISLMIFLLSLLPISYLITLGSQQSLLAQRKALAVQLAQAKLAEVTQGLTPLAPSGFTPFDADPSDETQKWRTNFSWRMDVVQDDVAGLVNVQVVVQRLQDGTNDVEMILGQKV